MSEKEFLPMLRLLCGGRKTCQAQLAVDLGEGRVRVLLMVSRLAAENQLGPQAWSLVGWLLCWWGVTADMARVVDD